MRKHSALALALVSAAAIPSGFSQSVISAHSGLVNFLEGVVFLDGQPLARKPGMFPRLRDGSTLMTESGRAEILLTPDTYIRIGEDSSIRMVSDSISDTQVELLAGSAILDSAKAPAGAFVTVVFRDASIRILKPGHYRMDAEPPQLRVFEGEAEVTRNGRPVKLESWQLMPLDGASVVKRFTQGSDGLLDLWSEERGELIASNLMNSQTLGDPLLDNGPGVPADLASYIGYVPLATTPPVGLSPNYGFGYAGPFSPYAGFGVGAYMPYPAAAFLYAPRRFTTIFATRPTVVGAVGSGFGFASPTRTIFVPRPGPGITTMPRGVGTVGVRGVGVRGAGGHR
jgi:hypothetical protein